MLWSQYHTHVNNTFTLHPLNGLIHYFYCVCYCADFNIISIFSLCENILILLKLLITVAIKDIAISNYMVKIECANIIKRNWINTFENGKPQLHRWRFQPASETSLSWYYQRNITSRFSSNSEADNLELLENEEEITVSLQQR